MVQQGDAAQELLDELVKATNEMEQRRVQARASERLGYDYLRYLKQAAIQGCEALNQLIDAPAFAQLLRDNEALTPGALTDLNDFLKSDGFARFLSIEQNLLLLAGLNEQLAKKLVANCRSLAHATRPVAPLTEQEVRDAVGLLRREACDLAEMAKDHYAWARVGKVINGQASLVGLVVNVLVIMPVTTHFPDLPLPFPRSPDGRFESQVSTLVMGDVMRRISRLIEQPTTRRVWPKPWPGDRNNRRPQQVR